MTSTKELVTDASGRKISLGRYKHYKGEFYQVSGICKHTETEEELVFYQSLHGDYAYWVRPVEMFFSEIEYENQVIPRFIFVGNDNK